MYLFKKGDRVVSRGNETVLIKTGEKGIVLSVSLTDSNTVYVRTEQGRVCRLKTSNLELDDSPADNSKPAGLCT